jgi:hypothetical protein
MYGPAPGREARVFPQLGLAGFEDGSPRARLGRDEPENSCGPHDGLASDETALVRIHIGSHRRRHGTDKTGPRRVESPGGPYPVASASTANRPRMRSLRCRLSIKPPLTVPRTIKGRPQEATTLAGVLTGQKKERGLRTSAGRGARFVRTLPGRVPFRQAATNRLRAAFLRGRPAR